MSSEAKGSDAGLQIFDSATAVEASVEGSSFGYHSAQDFQGFQIQPSHQKNTKLFQLESATALDVTETKLLSAISEKSADGDFISLSCPEPKSSKKTPLVTLTDKERSFLRFLDDMKNLKAKDIDTSSCQTRRAAYPRTQLQSLSELKKSWKPLFNRHCNYQLEKTEEQEHQKETNSSSDGEKEMNVPLTVKPVFVKMENGQETVKRDLLIPAENVCLDQAERCSLSPDTVVQDNVSQHTSPFLRPPITDANNIICENVLSLPDDFVDQIKTHSQFLLAPESQKKDLSHPSDQTGRTCSTEDVLQNWSHHQTSLSTVQHSDNHIVYPAKNNSKSHVENNDHLFNDHFQADINKGTIGHKKEDNVAECMPKQCLAQTDLTTQSAEALESIQECVMSKVCNQDVIDNATYNSSILNSSQNTFKLINELPANEESLHHGGTAGLGLDMPGELVVVSHEADHGDCVFLRKGLFLDTQDMFRTLLQDNYQRDDMFSVMDLCTNHAQGDLGRKTSITSNIQQNLVEDFGNSSEVWTNDPEPADDLVVPDDDLVVPSYDLVVPDDDLAVVPDRGFTRTDDNLCQSEHEDSFYDDSKEKRPREKDTGMSLPNFKWKYRPSCNVEEDIVPAPPEVLEQGLASLQPLPPSAGNSRGIRLGLSRKQKVKRLHYSSI